MSLADRVVLIDAVAAQMHDWRIGSEQQVRAVAAEMPIKLVDLNGDGTPEVIAQAAGTESGCSATGNCPFWIFQLKKDGYSVLLDGEAQIFRVQPNRTNGFHDIALSRHGSAFMSEVTEYKFDGTMYKVGACYNFQWGDADHWFKRPLLTPCEEK